MYKDAPARAWFCLRRASDAFSIFDRFRRSSDSISRMTSAESCHGHIYVNPIYVSDHIFQSHIRIKIYIYTYMSSTYVPTGVYDAFSIFDRFQRSSDSISSTTSAESCEGRIC